MKTLSVYNTPLYNESGGAWKEEISVVSKSPVTDGVVADEPNTDVVSFYGGKSVTIADENGHDILSVSRDISSAHKGECQADVYRTGQVVAIGEQTDVSIGPKTLHVSNGETGVDVNTSEVVVIGGVELTVYDKQEDTSIFAFGNDLLHIVPEGDVSLTARGIAVHRHAYSIIVLGDVVDKKAKDNAEDNEIKAELELGFDFASYDGKSVWLKYGSQVEILVLDDADMYVDDATKKIYFHGGVVTIKIDGKRALPPQRVKSGMINRDDGTIYCNGKELGKFKLPKP